MEAPVAIVTGAAKRLGRAIAKRLHQQGYRLVLHYRQSATDVQSLAAELNAIRLNSAVLCAMDLSCDSTTTLAARCESLMECCFCSFGRCDVLVNNASSYFATPLVSRDGDSPLTHLGAQASDILGSNALAPFFLISAFASRQCSNRECQSVVNLTDAMAEQPLPGFALYTMAKHALNGLTKAAAVDLAPLGIRVNAVAPGLSALPEGMPEAERAGFRSSVPLRQRETSPEDVAEAVAFLVSDKAACITGTTLNVDGGWSLTRSMP